MTPGRPRGFSEYQQRMGRVLTPAGIEAGLRFSPRAGDVIISPFGKCGTTWLQQIVHSLRTGGDLDFDDISRVVPWIETAHDLGIDLDAPQRAEPRAFKSHLCWTAVPKGARYIVSLRDPRDALVSMYRFMEGWFFEPGSVTIEEFARGRYLRRDEGTHYWAHLASWWEQRGNPDVLLLAYEHMKRDLPAAVRRVAGFLGIALDDDLLAVVLQQASLQSMRHHRDKYDDLLMRELSERVADIPPGSESSKVRDGAIGAHADILPASLIEELDAVWRAEITPRFAAPDYAALIADLPR